MEQGGFLGKRGRFPGKPPLRGGHRHERSAPAFCRFQPLVAAGEGRGEHLPFGAVCGTDMQCRGTRRARSSYAHLSILNSDFRFLWVVEENPKIPEIQCSLDLSSPRLPEMRRSHTISHPLFCVLILVSHL